MSSLLVKKGCLIFLMLIIGQVAFSQLYIKHDRKVDDFQSPDFSLDSLSIEKELSLKYVPLRKDRKVVLVNAIEERFRYELFDNEALGLFQPDDNGYILQRLSLINDLYFGNHIRLFSQLESAIISGRADGIRPGIDRNNLDFHQLFVETAWRKGDWSTGFRIGRQEYLQPIRVNTPRYGTNVQLSFDAIRWFLNYRQLNLETSYGLPSVNNPGVFDEFDLSEENERFWNVILGEDELLLGTLDVYLHYYGIKRKDANYNGIIADERRHSFGLSVFSEPGSLFDFDIEAIYQTGTFGDRNIAAWFVGSEAKYTFQRAGGKPSFGILAHVGSGDRNDSDAVNTFYGIYSELKYGGNIYVISTFSNTVQIHPELVINPSDKLSIAAKYDMFWRTSKDDAAYWVLQTPFRMDPNARSSKIGDMLSIGIDYQLSEHLKIGGDFITFYSDDFIEEIGPAGNVQYASFELSFYY